jgi:GxxExxY protein
MSKNILTAEDAESAEVMNINQLTDAVIGSAIEIHRALGPGLLESTYEMCLCHELSLRQIPFERQKPIPVIYKAVKLDCGYRADLLVDGRLLVEIKSVDTLAAIHEAQLLSYLKLGGWQIGLLINFNVQLLKSGIRRRVLNLDEEISL